jgi:hypothetical protein
LEEDKIESDILPHKTSMNIAKIMDTVRSQLNIIYPDYE